MSDLSAVALLALVWLTAILWMLTRAQLSKQHTQSMDVLRQIEVHALTLRVHQKRLLAAAEAPKNVATTTCRHCRERAV